MSNSEELYDYEYGIPPSDEVLLYEDRFGPLLNADWRARAYKLFKSYEERRRPLERTRAIGALGFALTKEQILKEIDEMEAHFRTS